MKALTMNYKQNFIIQYLFTNLDTFSQEKGKKKNQY